MGMRQAQTGGGGELRGSAWLDLAGAAAPSVVLVRSIRDVEPRSYNPDMAETPGVLADVAFVTGDRAGEAHLGEVLISAGVIRPLLGLPPGAVTVLVVGQYKSRGRSHPCLNPASVDQSQAAQEALDASAAAGHTFTDADGDTTGDVWAYYAKSTSQRSDSAEVPF